MSSSVRYVSDDAVSVTLGLGEAVLVSEGVAPYPHYVLRIKQDATPPVGAYAFSEPPGDSLLPPNASALERALESVIAAQFTRLLEAAQVINDVWDPDVAPAALLPFLAWGLSVDRWNPLWDAEQQRAVIRTALERQRRKGSVWAVRQALIDHGFPTAQIVEGDPAWRIGDGTHVGDPGVVIYDTSTRWAYYSVLFDRPMTEAQATELARALEAAAPARCHLLPFRYEAVPWVIGDGSLVGAPGLTIYGDASFGMVEAPASCRAPGTLGQTAWAEPYWYEVVAADAWARRAPERDWPAVEGAPTPISVGVVGAAELIDGYLYRCRAPARWVRFAVELTADPGPLDGAWDGVYWYRYFAAAEQLVRMSMEWEF